MNHARSVSAAVALALASASISVPLCAQQADHAAELEEVVVTASPIGDADRLATIAGSVARDELLRGGGNTLADALANVPGVTTSGFAAGAGRPVIRGMDANRVRTLENGVGSFDVSDVGPDHGVPIDPFTAERIEVVRGAATLRYGSQAIGGVVNAISQRVPTRLTADGFNGELSAGYNTGADSRDFAGQATGSASQFAWHADAFSRHAQDYDTPYGTQPGTWIRAAGGALGGSWIGADKRAGIGVIRQESRYGLPGEDSWIDMHQTKLLLRSSFDLAAGAWHALTVDAGWADYAHSERDEAGSSLATFKDREWDARAEAVAGRWGVLSESALGVQVQQRDFSALGEGLEYLLPTTTTSQAVFGFAEAPLGPRARLQFGARLEHVNVAGTAPDDSATRRGMTPMSASLGLVFDATDFWRLGLSLSSAGRAPAQTELFARGPHEGPGTFETGDPDLRVERANSAEVSLRWRGDRVHADGAVWATRFNRYIYGALTGRTCNEAGACVDGDGGEFKEMFYAQRSARFHGAEAHAQVELLQDAMGDLHLDVIADIVRADFGNGSGAVPRIPPWRIGAGLTWQMSQFDFGATVKYSARQSRVPAGESPTAGFTTIDAQLAWRPWVGHPDLEIAVVGRNLADSVQRNAVAFNRDELVLPGRDLRLTLRARID